MAGLERAAELRAWYVSRAYPGYRHLEAVDVPGGGTGTGGRGGPGNASQSRIPPA